MEIFPHELLRMAPSGVVPVATNLHLDRFGAEEWERAAGELQTAVEELDKFRVDLIAVDAAPLAYLYGPKAHEELAAELGRHARKPVLTDVSAAVAALRHLGAGRLALVSPFGPPTDDAMARFFVASGFAVLRVVSVPHGSVSELRRKPLSLAFDAAVRARQEAPEADALFIGGSDWAVAPHLQPLEDAFGIPVVGLCQATLWTALLRLGIREPIAGYGALLRGR